MSFCLARLISTIEFSLYFDVTCKISILCSDKNTKPCPCQDGIQIWRDNWVPGGNLRVSAWRTRTPCCRVADLLQPNSYEWIWNSQLVRNIFQRFDADEILKIRLPPSGTDDILDWHYERSGSFTVRSAYRLALNMKHHLDATSGSTKASLPLVPYLENPGPSY